MYVYKALTIFTDHLCIATWNLIRSLSLVIRFRANNLRPLVVLNWSCASQSVHHIFANFSMAAQTLLNLLLLKSFTPWFRVYRFGWKRNGNTNIILKSNYGQRFTFDYVKCFSVLSVFGTGWVLRRTATALCLTENSKRCFLCRQECPIIAIIYFENEKANGNRKIFPGRKRRESRCEKNSEIWSKCFVSTHITLSLCDFWMAKANLCMLPQKNHSHLFCFLPLIPKS